MSAEILQTVSQVMVVIGITLTALGGFGSYHFGKKVGDTRAREFKQSVDELLTRSQTLEDKLEPFHELAQTARPDLDQDDALDSLHQEIEQLREMAAKHEFTPLSPELRNKFLRRVQEFASTFATAGISILITHETWSPRTTRQYATQLAELLRQGGLNVEGPEQITYFLVTPSSPIEWGYNEADVPQLEILFAALLTIIRPNQKWSKASHQEPRSIRIHFGGQVIFEPSGIVAVN